MKDFMSSRWGAVIIWIVVMYLMAFIWNIVDSKHWYAFPTYLVSGLVWVGSFVYMLSFFLEWTGTSVRLKKNGSNGGDRPESGGGGVD